jgi:uncharacterized protein (TIGR00255 family)
MRSMTGFGAASKSRGGVSATVEARSVNNRFVKISVRTPSMLSAREHELEALIRERVTRGSVSLTVKVTLSDRPVRVTMSEGAVDDYVRLLTKLTKKTGGGEKVTADLLAGLPGVFSVEEMDTGLEEQGWLTVREAVELALTRLDRMRVKEGANLKRDFTARKNQIAGLVGRIGKRAPDVAREGMARREERVRRMVDGLGVEVEEKDLLRELAILSERSDVTEELTRLASHLDQFAGALKSEEPIGRRLDFLVQEMAREANTISAKSADVEVSRECVDLKVELDRLKEQVQNVE